MNDNISRINKRIIFAVIAMCVMALLLVTGTLRDRSISDTLYTPDNVICKALGILGPMPLFLVLIPMTAALFQRSLNSSSSAKIPAAVITAALTLGLCFFGARTFTSSDCLDAVIPSVRGNIAVMIPVTFALLPLVWLGFRAAQKNDDAKLIRRIILLIVVIGTAYAMQEIIKGTMHRPRYRTAILDLEGVRFMPWYEKFSGYSKELPDTLGVLKTEFASFPSGHSMMSMTCFITFPALAWLFPSLKGKENALALCGFLYSVVMMFSRVVMGAHYLSDVAFSGTAMLLFSIIYMVLLKKTYKEDQ